MNLGFGEILVLAILSLVIFGPEKLPEVARNVGRTVAKFRREANSTLDEFRRSADLTDLRELRNELRDMTADLKQHSPLTGPMAVRGFGGFGGLPPIDPVPRPIAHRPPTLRPSGAPPFDPDAT